MKELKRFPGYFIAESGEIISKKRKNTIKRKINIDCFGYYFCSLCQPDGKKVTVRIHRLIMEEYGTPPPENMIDPTVDHINGDKLDNRIENLQWLSNKDNSYKFAKHSIKSYVVEHKNGFIFNVENLNKWCRNNSLNRCTLRRSYKTGWWHKDYRIISIQDK